MNSQNVVAGHRERGHWCVDPVQASPLGFYAFKVSGFLRV